MAAKKKRVVKVDMSGVEVKRTVPEGQYRVSVSSIEQEFAEGDKSRPYLAWEFKILDGKNKGSTLYHNTSLQPQALWNLKGLLERLDVEVPDSAMDLDLDELVGQEIGVVVEHEEYNNRPRSRVVDFLALSEVDGDATEEKEENEVPSRDDIMILDEEELQAVVDEHGLDVDLDDHKGMKAKRTAVADALEAGAEEPEEEAPKGKKKPAEEPEEEPELVKSSEIDDMGTKELQALVEEHELDIELEGTTSAKRRAVRKALRAKELLDEEA